MVCLRSRVHSLHCEALCAEPLVLPSLPDQCILHDMIVLSWRPGNWETQSRWCLHGRSQRSGGRSAALHACRLTREHGTRRVLALPDVLGGGGGGGCHTEHLCPASSALVAPGWNGACLIARQPSVLKSCGFQVFLHTSGFMFHGDIFHHISPYFTIFTGVFNDSGCFRRFQSDKPKLAVAFSC